MSERITRLAVSAFRGVPGHFEVPLKRGESLIVLGENGTGKSTIADAIEYFMTGNVDFLRKEGRGHAVRHVGADPKLQTEVVLETDGDLSGRRAFPAPRFSARPRRDETETFLLRGRTLAEFIEKSKGEKWSTLCQILGLEEVDSLRLDLQTATNNLDHAAKTVAAEARSATQELEAQSIPATSIGILEAIKGSCLAAGVSVPATLEEVLTPAWLQGLGSPPVLTEDLRRTVLAADASLLPRYEPDLDQLQNWNEFAASLVAADEARVRLLNAGQTLLDQQSQVDHCPMCGHSVNDHELRQFVVNTLTTLRDAADDLARAEATGKSIVAGVNTCYGAYSDLVRRAGRLKVTLPPLPASPAAALSEQVRSRSPIDPERLRGFVGEIDQWHGAVAPVLDAMVPAARDTAQNPMYRLAVVVGLAGKWAEATRHQQELRKAAALAHQIFTRYQDEQRDYFAGILKQISERVGQIYGFLHPAEGLGAIVVEPMSEKGVELVVDFHGTRQQPPQGVLSESHLNSLAIALFLSMAETFNEKVGFLVLDDVVNSFDIPHRGRLAELLTSEYKGWQLIVLTHDEQFYRRLTRLGPDWSRLEFTSWSYEEGPRSAMYQTADMVAAARAALDSHDRVAAAAKGRRAVEEFLQEACEGIQAPLVFRRGTDNDRREIGELVKGFRHTLRDHKPSYEVLTSLMSAIEADVAAALNVEAHASQGRASEAEVTSALDRLNELIEYFTCPNCETRVWHRGNVGAFSCLCRGRIYPPPPK